MSPDTSSYNSSSTSGELAKRKKHTMPQNAHQKKPGTRVRSINRSSSHNKLTRLSTSSGGTTSALRPHLNRSKSTDSVTRPPGRTGVTRNNRLMGKLAGLQPLTKSNLGPILTMNRSSGSLKGLVVNTGGIRTSTRKGKAIMRLNEDNEDYEDIQKDDEQDDRGEEGRTEEHNGSGVHTSEAGDNTGTGETEYGKHSTHEHGTTHGPSAFVHSEPLLAPHSPSDLTQANPEQGHGGPQHPLSRYDALKSTLQSSEDLRTESGGTLGASVTSNLYGGSLLLSQLTGLMKKVDHTQPYAAVAPTSLDNMSGISFMANPIESTNYQNIAEPVVSGKNAVPASSYQPEQTIFSNLQRTNSQYNAPRRHNMNLSNYLSSNSNGDHAHNIETRTQQRLWLQRENSMMDIGENHNFSSLSLNKLMFSHNYSLSNIKDLESANAAVHTNNAGTQQANGAAADPGAASSNSVSGLLRMLQSGQNSIQSRTEFERLNREYLNVRRHLNPVGESLSRLEKLKDDVKVPKRRTRANANGRSNANNFKEFSPQAAEQEQEITSQLNRLWQQALLSSLASSSTSPAPKPQRPAMTQRGSSFNMRSPQTPTTRAVKLKQRAN